MEARVGEREGGWLAWAGGSDWVSGHLSSSSTEPEPTSVSARVEEPNRGVEAGVEAGLELLVSSMEKTPKVESLMEEVSIVISPV